MDQSVWIFGAILASIRLDFHFAESYVLTRHQSKRVDARDRFLIWLEPKIIQTSHFDRFGSFLSFIDCFLMTDFMVSLLFLYKAFLSIDRRPDFAAHRGAKRRDCACEIGAMGFLRSATLGD